MTFKETIDSYETYSSNAQIVLQSGILIAGILTILALGVLSGLQSDLVLVTGVIIFWTSLLSNIIIQEVENVS